MKRFLILTLLLVFTAKSYADNWSYNLEEGKKIALATNKLVLVDFWATWCGPCRKMDAESWSTDEVKFLMENYVPVKVDIDNNKSIANSYDVKAIPFVFILDGNGMVIYKSMSYMTKPEVMELLKSYALNTEYMSNEMINFYKKKNFITSYRLAEKYQNYSLYLSEDIRQDFVKTSEAYLDLASDELSLSKLTSKEALRQKLELFEIQAKLLQNKPKKALKLLSKISPSKLYDTNSSFYDLLNYVAQSMLENQSEALTWESKLGPKQLNKAKKIINLKT